MDHVFTYTQGTRGSHVQAVAREHGATPSHIRQKYTTKKNGSKTNTSTGKKKFPNQTLPHHPQSPKKKVSQKNVPRKNYTAKNKPFLETKKQKKQNQNVFETKSSTSSAARIKRLKNASEKIYNKKKLFSKTNSPKNKVAEQTLPHRYK